MRQRAAERKQRAPVAPARLTRSAQQEPARPTVSAELALRRELTAEQAESQEQHPKAQQRFLPAQRPVS